MVVQFHRHIFAVRLWVGKEYCFQTVCFMSVFVLWSLVRCFAVTLPITFMAAVSIEGAFLSKMPATTIPASRWFLLCYFRWLLSLIVLIVDVVAGTNCCTISDSCFKFTSHRHSSVTCCRVKSGFCSIFDKILVRTSVAEPISMSTLQIFLKVKRASNDSQRTMKETKAR